MVEREGDALGGLGEPGVVEDEAEQVGVAVEGERELHVGERDAVEAREKVMLVAHGYKGYGEAIPG